MDEVTHYSFYLDKAHPNMTLAERRDVHHTTDWDEVKCTECLAYQVRRSLPTVVHYSAYLRTNHPELMNGPTRPGHSPHWQYVTCPICLGLKKSDDEWIETMEQSFDGRTDG